MKIIKQLFLFLIPTLIVAFVFISSNQQNILATDDSDSNTVTLKIDTPDRNSNHGNFQLNFCVAPPGIGCYAPILAVIGNTLVFATLLSCSNNLCNVRNHSPPTLLNS